MINACRICQGTELRLLFHDDQVPVSQVPVLPDHIEFEQVGRMEIVLCERCSHIFNRAFDDELMRRTYATNYTASLPVSPQALERCRSIADHLFQSERRFTTAVEIGGGDLTFSRLLLERGVEKICVFEPAKSFTNTDPRIETINDFFQVRLTPDKFISTDLIVVRHVLEHVADPAKMVAEAARLLRTDGIIYIEVPNVEDIFTHQKFYDFIYEHVNHFSEKVVYRLLLANGIQPISTTSLANGQHMGIVGVKRDEAVYPVQAHLPSDEFEHDREWFSQVKEFQCNKFLQDLQNIVDRHKNIAIYGAGAHSTTLCAMLKLPAGSVQCLYDLSPFKHGRVSPLTHIPIVSPNNAESVKEHDALLILAPIHEDDIHRNLREDYGFHGPIYGIYPHIRKLA